jgi:glycosidase
MFRVFRAAGLLFCAVNALAGQAAWAVTPPKVIYEIFPRSFQDSDGDGVGDLQGVISRLDYLNDGTANSLGVDAIWLTPIFPSPSYHGYDITDYDSVRPEYGDLPALKKLIAEAHRRGIRVLLDVAVNHTSMNHPWFNAFPEAKNLYLWSPKPLDWSQGQGAWHARQGEYYFSTFSAKMPDLNWRNPQVLARIEDVFKFWVSIGVDGFRLDAAKFLIKGPQGQDNQPETHALWKQIVHSTREVAPDTFFVGEIWDSAQNIASYYGSGDELDAAFDFPTMQALRDSFVARDAGAFAAALSERVKIQPKPGFAAPFAGNHDLTRLASATGGDVAQGILAAVAVMTLPGSATLYYGDEIGIPEGAQTLDVGKRTPMQWDNSPSRGFTAASQPWTAFSSNEPAISVASQGANPRSLLSAYKKLIHLRVANSFLFSGTVSEVRSPAPGVVSYVRSDPEHTDDRALVVLNFSKVKLPKFEIPLSDWDAETAAHVLWGSAQAQAVAKGLAISNLAAESATIFVLSE